MKAFASRIAAVTAALIVGGSWVSVASAQELFAGDLMLRKTYIKTDNGLVPLDVSVKTPIFTPTTITCQNGQECVVRIELSTVANLVAGVPAGLDISAHVTVRVDGHPRFSDDPEIVFPGHEILLGHATAGTSTFSWMTAVSPGDHTIDVLVSPQYGGTGIFLKARTLTIQVYKP
jgi:hypothetical protein